MGEKFLSYVEEDLETTISNIDFLCTVIKINKLVRVIIQNNLFWTY